MSEQPSRPSQSEPPAMGERRARWGFGYQDKVATERILTFLRKDLREGSAELEGVRLADLEAGRVDDFVLVWGNKVEGNSIKWSRDAAPFTWGDLIGASGLLKELASGYDRLRGRWPGRAITVRLQTNRPASTDRHHAQLITSFSIHEFVTTHWALGPDTVDSIEAREAWRRIAEHIGLSGSELSTFAASCELSFGRPEPPASGGNSLDERQYRKQFDGLHKAIATWLTNTPRGDFIDRDYLLAAIGFQTNRSGLIQRFPEPEIPYEKNRAAAGRLKAMIDATAGGYLAVLGPAGVGKSTLVQDVLTDSLYPFFVPYYAFLPSTDGNRDRSEALTFFQDVIGRLDRFDSTRLSLGIADIAQGRDALRRHMTAAHQRYVGHGQKTILLIDGLDHVIREVNLETPVVHELPHPDEVPEGFVIILSGQPQAFLPGTIPAAIAAAVQQDTRWLEVPGLSRPEVHTLVSKVRKATTGDERDALYDSCLGNPLILTYLLALFERADDITVETTIELAGRYAGRIDQYYKERLSAPLQNVQTRRLLGLLCRAAPTIPVAWLSEWPERDTIEDVYERVLAPFVRVDDGVVRFIHDSLIAFLRAETRSRLPGSDPVQDERALHSVLADRSSGRSCIDAVGRARVVHLMRAGRYADVLAQASSDWLRAGLLGFLPFAHIRPVLLSGFTAACATENWGDALRLTLLSYELDQRTSRVDAGRLADALLDLDDPLLALSQIRSDGRLLVEDTVALRFAGALWSYADRRNRSDLKVAARTLYLQAKPISTIYAAEPIDTDIHNEQQQSLAAWSAVAGLFEQAAVITEEIGKLKFTSRDDGYHPDVLTAKAHLLFSALDAAIADRRDLKECQILADALGTLGSPVWKFIGLFRLAESMPSAATAAELHLAYSAAEVNDDITLAYAWFLSQRGDQARAFEVVRRLPHIRFETTVRATHSWGFSDVTYTVRLRWLQELLDVPEGPVPDAKDDREEAYARVERAARQLGALRALVARGHTPTNRGVLFRSLLLFHNLPVQFDTLSPHQGYVIQTSKNAIYRQVARLAEAIGPSTVGVLRDVVLDVTTGPAGAQLAPDHRRYFARLFYEQGIMSRERAVELGLSSTADSVDEDPTQRQEACLEIATFLHRLGDKQGAENWKKRSGEVSAGAGTHKDYHMAHVADWLARSVSRAEPDDLAVLERFARAVEVAGGRGGADAAATQLQMLLRLSPARAWRLAVEFVERRVLYVSDVVEALIVGGAAVQASPELLSAVYCELHSLIASDSTADVAVAVLRAFPRQPERDIAFRLMSHARTNALPSHRAEVGRALADAVREEGLDAIVLTQDLKPGRDDSSRKSSLYLLATGEMETIDQVAERLSDSEHPDAWNPNPDDNTEFGWWEAIKKVKLKHHLDALVARFPPPDYRGVELLVCRADMSLQLGDRNSAGKFVERAIVSAKDGSWHRWFDGGQKVIAFNALKVIDHGEGVRRAREQFSKDFRAGKLSPSNLLSDISEILDLLEIEWPADAVRDAINDYTEQILAANDKVAGYEAFAAPVPSYSADHALCRFIAELLAFPVVDVGVSARRVLAQYLRADGKGLIALLSADQSWLNPIQIEHLLAAVHVGSTGSSANIAGLRTWVEGLNRSQSLAVRSIAKRIADEQGWAWEDISTEPVEPIILLAGESARRREAGMLLGGDATIGWNLHQALIRPLEQVGLDLHELRSEFERLYGVLEREYPWCNDGRLKRWMRQLLARFWLNPRAIIGREAAMRVFGRSALSGQVPAGAEAAYDYFYPIYDRHLELYRPIERPREFQAMEWRISGGEGRAWREGANANNWSEYPQSVQGLALIGERTWLIRPDWEWPREERHRGLIAGALSRTSERSVLESDSELTYEMYVRGLGQDDRQLIVLNSERQLAGPAYRWAAINANLARELGWHLSADIPFQWLDREGKSMVTSTYWKDGWIWIEPPRSEALGEGWFVLATPGAIDAIRRHAPGTDVHLWVERHSHGQQPYEGEWHLSMPL
jgi:hypothetical protein